MMIGEFALTSRDGGERQPFQGNMGTIDNKPCKNCDWGSFSGPDLPIDSLNFGQTQDGA